MTGARAGARASRAILDRKGELAKEITDAIYADDHTLLERFGERGRAKCLQDMHYCLEQLAPALELEDPPLFARYVLWLESLLAARAVGTDDVRRSLTATGRVLTARLSPDEAASARLSLDAGLAALSASATP